MKAIVELTEVSKHYRVTKRSRAGLGAAMKSLVCREYHDVKAVNQISMEVKRGEIRALIGPNGAGKSTVLKMISGVLYPTEGQLRVMGCTPWEDREKLVKQIGVVFGQKSGLWWDLPAIDAFHLNKIIYDIPEHTYERNLEYFVHHLQVQDVMTKPVRQLSLGERMKCEFILALLHEPPLVILDEPTIGLDVFSKEEIRKFILDVNRDKQITFLITTHDLADVDELCENITVINQGTVTFDDTMEHLKEYYAHRKILELQFVLPVSRVQLEGYRVISCDGYCAKVEVDRSEVELQSCISQLWERLPLTDMNVKNVSIEEVIKDIYTKKEIKS